MNGYGAARHGFGRGGLLCYSALNFVLPHPFPIGRQLPQAVQVRIIIEMPEIVVPEVDARPNSWIASRVAACRARPQARLSWATQSCGTRITKRRWTSIDRAYNRLRLSDSLRARKTTT